MLEGEYEASSSEVVAHRGADVIVRLLVSMQRSSRNPLAACPVDVTGRPQIVLGPGGALGRTAPLRQTSEILAIKVDQTAR